MAKRRPIYPPYLALVLVAIIFAAVLLILQPPFSLEAGIIRGAALLGFQFIFFSIISSAFMRQLARAYGQPFVKMHHWVSVTGLVLITIHPLMAAWQAMSLTVFIPSFASWGEFWTLAGRPAWYLLVIAAIAALLRRQFRSGWRIVHYLNYIALLFGAVHAARIGGSVAPYPVVQIILYIQVALALAVFVQRRYVEQQRAQARSERNNS